MNNYKTLLEVAKNAAVKAGVYLKTHVQEMRVVAGESEKDVKIKGDKAAEELIFKELKETGFAILGEEQGWHGRRGETCWVVDPLDGSVNFRQGIPLCSVSIAFVEKGEPVLGVVYNFFTEELYHGVVGVGAFCNDERLQVSDVSEPKEAILATGLPARRDFSHEALEIMVEDFGRWRKVRMLGSASIMLAYVASGRVDAYREENIMFWDVAAGCALVAAAGGAVCTSGEQLDQPVIVAAANKKLIASCIGQEKWRR